MKIWNNETIEQLQTIDKANNIINNVKNKVINILQQQPNDEITNAIAHVFDELQEDIKKELFKK